MRLIKKYILIWFSYQNRDTKCKQQYYKIIGTGIN
jgi:hypothetical protein